MSDQSFHNKEFNAKNGLLICENRIHRFYIIASPLINEIKEILDEISETALINIRQFNVNYHLNSLKFKFFTNYSCKKI